MTSELEEGFVKPEHIPNIDAVIRDAVQSNTVRMFNVDERERVLAEEDVCEVIEVAAPANQVHPASKRPRLVGSTTSSSSA